MLRLENLNVVTKSLFEFQFMFQFMSVLLCIFLQKSMEEHINECYDSIAIFLSIHIVHRYRSIMESRGVPALERFVVLTVCYQRFLNKIRYFKVKNIFFWLKCKIKKTCLFGYKQLTAFKYTVLYCQSGHIIINILSELKLKSRAPYWSSGSSVSNLTDKINEI